MDPKVEETRGWRALKALVAKSSQSEVFRKTGVPQPILSQLIRLQRKPGRKTTMALAKAGIRGEWWDQPLRKAA
jgi:hypothetical protein